MAFCGMSTKISGKHRIVLLVDLLHPLFLVCQTATHNHFITSFKCLAPLIMAHIIRSSAMYRSFYCILCSLVTATTVFRHVICIHAYAYCPESLSHYFQCGTTQQSKLRTYPLHMHGAYSTLSFCTTICTVFECIYRMDVFFVSFDFTVKLRGYLSFMTLECEDFVLLSNQLEEFLKYVTKYLLS